jgi:hypothetical protein
MEEYISTHDPIISRDFYSQFQSNFQSKSDFWTYFFSLDQSIYFSNGLPYLSESDRVDFICPLATDEEIKEQIEYFASQDKLEATYLKDFLEFLVESEYTDHVLILLEKYKLEKDDYLDLMDMTSQPVLQQIIRSYLFPLEIYELKIKNQGLQNIIKSKDHKISILRNIKEFLCTTCLILVSINIYQFFS